jgi:type IV fimbrial biogenesis protein FimT
MYIRNYNNQRGFTLIELLVTIAVAAIIASLAAPSFSNMLVKQQLNSSARDLAATLTKARSQAVLLRRNVSVHIAPATATTLSATVMEWKPSGATTLKSATTNPTQIIFISTGTAQAKIGTADPVAITDSHALKICDAKEVKAISVQVSIMGTVRQTEGTCA